MICVPVLACSGDDDAETTPTGTSPAPTLEATASPIPDKQVPTTPRTTGVAELDSFLDLVESNDVAMIRDLIDLQTLPCTTALGLGGPPQCREGETEGTEVSVFAFSVCEPEWLREEQITPNLEQAFSYTFRRYAAYEEDGNYVAVFEAEEEPVVGAAVAVTVIMDSGRIVKISRICGAGEGGEGLIPQGRSEFLLDPP
jgi:hypothetical protein